MRLGLVARGEFGRGLAIMCVEFAKHLKPARTLIVDLGPLSPYPCVPEQYTEGERRVARYDPAGRLDDADLDWLIEGTDVILTAETFYDYRLAVLARERGTKTVLHTMPEFARWPQDPDLPKPDVLLAPTAWLLKDIGLDCAVLPMPVDRERCAFRRRGTTDPVTFLHVAGHKAIHDRNGTMTVAQAWREGVPGALVVRSQSNVGGFRGDRVRIEQGDVDDYARLYDEGDVLILTRRYGGQALSIDQALSCGMPVIATDREPERSLLPAEWLVPATRTRSFPGQPGPIPLEDPSPPDLAAKMRLWANEPEIVYEASLVADEIAESYSWETLGPVWRAMLEEVAR